MGFRWASEAGGELVADGGALVSPNWSWIQVPLGDARPEPGVLTDPLVLEGDGWKLSLPAGWRVTRNGRRYDLMPPRP
jgi:hypothetical protein